MNNKVFKNLFQDALFNNDLNLAVEISIKNLPKCLYKILPTKNDRIKTLEDESVWFSNPNFFDDFLDTGFWKNEDLNFESIIKASNVDPNTFENIDAMKSTIEFAKEKLRKDVKNIFHSLSLFEDIENPVYWSMYGDNGKGFAIQYNFNHSKSLELDYMVFPVIYSNTPLDLNETLKRKDTFQYLLSLYKGDCWSFQNEWRCLVKPNEIDKGTVKKAPKIEAVYLGLKCLTEHKIDLIEIAKQKKILVYEMIPSWNSCNLIAKPIYFP